MKLGGTGTPVMAAMEQQGAVRGVERHGCGAGAAAGSSVPATGGGGGSNVREGQVRDLEGWIRVGEDTEEIQR